jgi:hypothetical protein
MIAYALRTPRETQNRMVTRTVVETRIVLTEGPPLPEMLPGRRSDAVFGTLTLPQAGLKMPEVQWPLAPAPLGVRTGLLPPISFFQRSTPTVKPPGRRTDNS